MTDYVKSTNFASKDSLASGNALKIVKGTEIDTEFNNIATAVATKADLNTPTFTGNVTGTFVGNVTGNVTGNASTVTNGVYTTGNQTIGGEKTFSSTLYLADGGMMFNSDTGRDTGFNWASDGVMNVRSNGVTIGQFNNIGFTGNAATAINAQNATNATNATTASTASDGFGINQTWQDVSGSRSDNVWYQNTTGKAIHLFIKNIFGGDAIRIGTSTGSFVTMDNGDADSDLDNGAFWVVPKNNYYYVINSVQAWFEMR